jgi:hypothetical protein
MNLQDGQKVEKSGPDMANFDLKQPVQTMYTEAHVLRHIRARIKAGLSYRKMAKFFGWPITHADIQRIVKDGKFPVRIGKRWALHIPPMCPTCDQPLPTKPKFHKPAWLDQAVENLQKLEQAKGPKKDEYRVYARGGKRVRDAHPFTPF